jgi:hypothetical protein
MSPEELWDREERGGGRPPIVDGSNDVGKKPVIFNAWTDRKTNDEMKWEESMVREIYPHLRKRHRGGGEDSFPASSPFHSTTLLHFKVTLTFLLLSLSRRSSLKIWKPNVCPDLFQAVMVRINVGRSNIDGSAAYKLPSFSRCLHRRVKKCIKTISTRSHHDVILERNSLLAL